MQQPSDKQRTKVRTAESKGKRLIVKFLGQMVRGTKMRKTTSLWTNVWPHGITPTPKKRRPVKAINVRQFCSQLWRPRMHLWMFCMKSEITEVDAKSYITDFRQWPISLYTQAAWSSKIAMLSGKGAPISNLSVGNRVSIRKSGWSSHSYPWRSRSYPTSCLFQSPSLT